jgi:hypothetical protein
VGASQNQINPLDAAAAVLLDDRSTPFEQTVPQPGMLSSSSPRWEKVIALAASPRANLAALVQTSTAFATSAGAGLLWHVALRATTRHS